MRKGRFTEEQIINTPPDYRRASRKYGISDATFYEWRSRYGGMEIFDTRKLKGLEEENRKLKKLLAESMLDVSTLKEMLGKNF
jgi:putative transposase